MDPNLDNLDPNLDNLDPNLFVDELIEKKYTKRYRHCKHGCDGVKTFRVGKRLDNHEAGCSNNPDRIAQQTVGRPKKRSAQQSPVVQLPQQLQLWHCLKRKRDGKDMTPFTAVDDHRYHCRCELDQIYPCSGIGCQDCPVLGKFHNEEIGP